SVPYGPVTASEGGGAHVYDPASRALVGVWLRQIATGGIYHNFTYWRLSRDQGRTWSVPRQLRYAEGEEFDPKEPLKPAFLGRNEGYTGSSVTRLASGTLVHCVTSANAPGDPENDRRAWKLASLCFLGKWDPEARDYTWTAGKRVEIAPEVSSRGLMEAETAELQDGRLLVIWRGSNTATTPGRKWFSVSADEGRTLAPVQELKYDDGSRFYSPS